MGILQVLLSFCVVISITMSRGNVLPRWSKWSEVSSCYSSNCTDLQQLPLQFRFRWCFLSEEDDGMCQGPHLLADTCFAGANCPIDGQWGAWSEWKCDRKQQITERKRECNKPPPENGGKDCNPKDSTEFIEKEADEKHYMKICKPLKPENPGDIGGDGSGDEEWDEEETSGNGNNEDGHANNEEDDDWK